MGLLAIRQRRTVTGVFTFIESSAFERICSIYLDDDEYAELQQFMSRIQKPARPVLVAFANFAGHGRAWVSGVVYALFYFVRYEPNEFGMLTIYAKARREDVPAHILKQLLEAFRHE